MAGRMQKKGKSLSDGERCCFNCRHASLVTDRWIGHDGKPTLCNCHFEKWLVLPTKCETGMFEKKQA